MINIKKILVPTDLKKQSPCSDKLSGAQGRC